MGLLIAAARAGSWRHIAASVAWLTAAACLPALPAPAQEPPALTDTALPSETDLETRLRVTCEQRMGQLQTAQEQSLAGMRWQQDAIGMRGEFVGYAPDYECTLSTPVQTVPVGRMRYREIRFEKRGESVDDAMRAEPAPLSIEDVTQVLVYRDGYWK